jgi:hypothetical protein
MAMNLLAKLELAAIIHLDPKLVPMQLRGNYSGQKFSAEVVMEMTIPRGAGTWGGGSRDVYSMVRLADGKSMPLVDTNLHPDKTEERKINVEPGMVVVRESQGNFKSLHFYVNPADTAKLLPKPAEGGELNDKQLIVLSIVSSLISSARRDEARRYGINEKEYIQILEELKAKKLVKTNGGIDVSGRNLVAEKRTEIYDLQRKAQGSTIVTTLLAKLEQAVINKSVYYTLVTRENGKWGPQFGDYDRKIVMQELRDSYLGLYKLNDMKIISTGPKQADINEAVRKLNAEKADTLVDRLTEIARTYHDNPDVSGLSDWINYHKPSNRFKHAIIHQLAKHVKRGKYDPEQAKKSWRHLADFAALTYHKEHYKAGGELWHKAFPLERRKLLAEHLETVHRRRVHNLGKKMMSKSTAAESQDEISQRLRVQNKREEETRLNSAWIKLMEAPREQKAALIAKMSPADAKIHLARLDAAPGDDPEVRKHLTAKAAHVVTAIDLVNTSRFGAKLIKAAKGYSIELIDKRINKVVSQDGPFATADVAKYASHELMREQMQKEFDKLYPEGATMVISAELVPSTREQLIALAKDHDYTVSVTNQEVKITGEGRTLFLGPVDIGFKFLKDKIADEIEAKSEPEETTPEEEIPSNEEETVDKVMPEIPAISAVDKKKELSKLIAAHKSSDNVLVAHAIEVLSRFLKDYDTIAPVTKVIKAELANGPATPPKWHMPLLPLFKDLNFVWTGIAQEIPKTGNDTNYVDIYSGKHYKILVRNNSIKYVTNAGLVVFSETITSEDDLDRAIEFLESFDPNTTFMGLPEQVAVAKCGNETPRFWIENNNLLENEAAWASQARALGNLEFDYFAKPMKLSNSSFTVEFKPGIIWQIITAKNDTTARIKLQNKMFNVSLTTLHKLLANSLRTNEKTKGLLLQRA